MEEKCDPTNYCPICRMYSRFQSSETGRHLASAKKEILMAIKSLIEKEIERTERESTEQAKKVDIT